MITLLGYGLEEQAWLEWTRLVEVRPDWRSDGLLVADARELGRRSGQEDGVIEY